MPMKHSAASHGSVTSQVAATALTRPMKLPTPRSMSPAAITNSWLIAANASANAAENTSVRPKLERINGFWATQVANTTANVTSGISAEIRDSRRRARSAASCAGDPPPASSTLRNDASTSRSSEVWPRVNSATTAPSRSTSVRSHSANSASSVEYQSTARPSSARLRNSR